MNMVTWVLIGSFAGLLVSLFDSDDSWYRLPGNMLLGISGALAGGLTANILSGYSLSFFNITAVVLAISVAIALLAIGRRMYRL